MEYRVLGPLEVLDESGQKVSLGGAMQQSVLASLLLHAGQTVALDRLIDELWDEPPATAARTVQAYVSRLRRELPDGAIETRAGGYAFVLRGDELDLTKFKQRADDGRAALAAEDFERSAALLEQALALWRGTALGGLTSDALRREADRLEEERLVVLEDRSSRVVSAHSQIGFSEPNHWGLESRCGADHTVWLRLSLCPNTCPVLAPLALRVRGSARHLTRMGDRS